MVFLAYVTFPLYGVVFIASFLVATNESTNMRAPQQKHRILKPLLNEKSLLRNMIEFEPTMSHNDDDSVAAGTIKKLDAMTVNWNQRQLQVSAKKANSQLPEVSLALTLVNSVSDQDIPTIEFTNGAVLDLSQVGRFLNVRVDCDQNVTTVDFWFDGDFVRTELIEPYSLGGNLFGNYKRFLPLVVTGYHEIDARAMVENTQVGQIQVGFQVVDQTFAPTQRHTLFPTPAPTSSEQPSEIPSHLPSDLPSLAPPTLHSDSPSDVPSYGPSDEPSDSPSDQPSDSPSDQPSDSPSDQPSDSPSDQPSDSPSDQPSDSPSDQPSDSPSDQPSDSPSDQPSDSPSDQPSDSPSDQPSDSPSDQPSDSPSDQPSDVPSDVPSNLPTETLSDPPSDLPSDVPSNHPTETPSDQPLRRPSHQPSIISSDQPSGFTYFRTQYFVNAGSDFKRPRFFTANETTANKNNKTAVSATDPYQAFVFQSYRSGNFINYTFPGLKPYSMHSVTLGFAEIYQPLCREGANGRVFDVFVNDVPFLVDMNVVDFVPCFSAHFEQGLFEADDTGHIVILFNATSGKAFVSMIEIQTVLST